MKNVNTVSRFRILGINDDASFCECCGKRGLKRVVFIEDREMQEIKHFGTTCALNPAKNFDALTVEKLVSMKKMISRIEADKWKRVSFKYKAMGGKMTFDGKNTWKVADMALYDEATKVVETLINQEITNLLIKAQAAA